MTIRQLVLLTLAFLFLVATLTATFVYWRRDANVRLVLTTGETSGTYYPLGNLIADAVAATHSRVTIKVEESAGSLENMRRLCEGSADLAIVQNDTAPDSSTVRTLVPLHRGVFHFLARKDANIHSIHDLAERRVAIGPRDSGSLHVVRELLRHFGLTEESFTPFYEGLGAGPKLLAGEIDAMLTMATVESDAVQQLLQNGEVTYVSLADSGEAGNEIEGFAITYPYVERFTIPRSVHPVTGDPGQPSTPCETFSLRSTLICRHDLSPQVARFIVEGILSHRPGMMRSNRAAGEISEQFSPRDIQFPLHDGAAAYYQRQQPTLLERYAEPMAFLLSALLALCGLIAALAKWVTLRKKNRIDVYYSRLDAILAELNGEPHPDEFRLVAIERELIAMRHDAVRELVNERLRADDSFQIFQSLLTECQRQLLMQRGA